MPPDGWRATRRIIDQWGAGHAIITLNDRLAFGAYQALHEAGLSVPSDVSLVSFDDSPLADWLRPGLTTFAIPHHDLGRRAVELLVELIADDNVPTVARPAVHRVRLPLRVRGSVGRGEVAPLS